MTGPTNPTDAAACLALAQRQVGDVAGWTAEQWAAQLAEDALTRGDPPATYHRPYRTALAYATRPVATNRSEGDVSEAYSVNLLTALADRLRELDAEWTAARIPPETSTPDEWASDIDWGSW